MTIIVSGTITLDPAKADDAMVAAVKAMEATHQEPGNRDYVFSLDPATPGKIRIYEEWESQEALDAHFTTPHMAEFMGGLGDFGVTGTEINKHEVASSTKLM